MLTTEIIEEEIMKNHGLKCSWSSRYDNKNCFDLFLDIGNCGYRIAVYRKKQKQILLTCPDIFVPDQVTLKHFMELCEGKEGVNNGIRS